MEEEGLEASIVESGFLVDAHDHTGNALDRHEMGLFRLLPCYSHPGVDRI